MTNPPLPQAKTPTTAELQDERDAIACLALYARAFQTFDVPVDFPGDQAPSHVAGLNIHALVIDNIDGELLGFERNTIQAIGSPLEHAEQRTIRAAIARVLVKRERAGNQSVEGYYRSRMFLDAGEEPVHFFEAGATLYTTLEPCPMCASTLLVCRMKCLCHLIPDATFGGSWLALKGKYYKKDPTKAWTFGPTSTANPVVDHAVRIHSQILARVQEFGDKVRATHVLDHCRPILEQAFQALIGVRSASIVSPRNAKTLADCQRYLGIPVQ